jgi:anti-sigma factor RsiW
MTNGCDQARAKLNRFLDNDLSGREATDIAAHLEACAACRQEFEALRAVRGALHVLETIPTGADDARERVFARLEKVAQSPEIATNRKPGRPVAERLTTWLYSLAWRPTLATMTAAVVVGAVFFLNQPGTVETPAERTELPGPGEMSLLFELHDAHVGALTGEDPVLRRTQAAEAHAALLQRADDLVSGNL